MVKGNSGSLHSVWRFITPISVSKLYGEKSGRFFVAFWKVGIYMYDKHWLWYVGRGPVCVNTQDHHRALLTPRQANGVNHVLNRNTPMRQPWIFSQLPWQFLYTRIQPHAIKNPYWSWQAFGFWVQHMLQYLFSWLWFVFRHVVDLSFKNDQAMWGQPEWGICFQLAVGLGDLATGVTHSVACGDTSIGGLLWPNLCRPLFEYTDSSIWVLIQKCQNLSYGLVPECLAARRSLVAHGGDL